VWLALYSLKVNAQFQLGDTIKTHYDSIDSEKHGMVRMDLSFRFATEGGY